VLSRGEIRRRVAAATPSLHSRLQSWAVGSVAPGSCGRCEDLRTARFLFANRRGPYHHGQLGESHCIPVLSSRRAAWGGPDAPSRSTRCRSNTAEVERRSHNPLSSLALVASVCQNVARTATTSNGLKRSRREFDRPAAESPPLSAACAGPADVCSRRRSRSNRAMVPSGAARGG
jgi:hypothetical protein